MGDADIVLNSCCDTLKGLREKNDAYNKAHLGTPLPDLAETPAAAARYHLLPVMVTVLFEPGHTTRELAALPATTAAWAALRGEPGAARPGTVSEEQWRARHDAAVEVLLGRAECAGAAAAMHCEVQLSLAIAATLCSCNRKRRT